MRISKQQLRSKQAFTIAEVLIALTITGVILAGFFSIIWMVANSSKTTTERAAQSVEIRGVVDRFYQQARSISEVMTAKDNEFKFRRLNMAGATEVWTYSWDGDDFTIQQLGQSSTTPLSDVKDVTFTYYEHRNQETDNYTLANAVQITLKIERPSESGGIEEVVQTPLVTFRNHKLL